MCDFDAVLLTVQNHFGGKRHPHTRILQLLNEENLIDILIDTTPNNNNKELAKEHCELFFNHFIKSNAVIFKHYESFITPILEPAAPLIKPEEISSSSSAIPAQVSFPKRKPRIQKSKPGRIIVKKIQYDDSTPRVSRRERSKSVSFDESRSVSRSPARYVDELDDKTQIKPYIRIIDTKVSDLPPAKPDFSKELQSLLETQTLVLINLQKRKHELYKQLRQTPNRSN
jgi:hypothetical protein